MLYLWFSANRISGFAAMKKIRLTGQLGGFALVDDSFAWLANFKWYQRPDGYAERTVGTIKKGRKHVRMHHCIIGFPLYGKEIDHINHNRLDNRQKNLRIVTKRENSLNHGVQPQNTTGIVGVYYLKKANRWMAATSNNHKTVYLGCFATKKEAAKARKQFEKTSGHIFGGIK